MSSIVDFFTGGYKVIKAAEIANASLTRLVSLTQSYKKAVLYWSPIVNYAGATTVVATSICFFTSLRKQTLTPEKSPEPWNYLLIGSMGVAISSGIFWMYAHTCCADMNHLLEKCKQRLIQELIL